MAHVEIYTKPYCPYCIRAKALLDHKGIAFVETDISGDPALRQVMIERSGGGETVPQIFIDGEAVGGCDDLHALDRAGRLDPMLGLAP